MTFDLDWVVCCRSCFRESEFGIAKRVKLKIRRRYSLRLRVNLASFVSIFPGIGCCHSAQKLFYDNLTLQIIS